MPEVRNSGRGGYCCDICWTMLWEGRDAKDKKDKRKYTYDHGPGDIWQTQTGMYKFCKKCGPKAKTRRKEW